MSETVDRIGVHQTHCCVYHGCKYGDSDCPVMIGETTQKYPCEECMYDPMLEIIDHLDDLIKHHTPVGETKLLIERVRLKEFVIGVMRDAHGCDPAESDES